MVSTGPCAQDEPLNLNSSNDKLFNFSIYFSHQILCLYGTISWKVWQEKLIKTCNICRCTGGGDV